MTESDVEKQIGTIIRQAIHYKVHHMNIVAILLAHQHSLLTQAYDANREKIIKPGRPFVPPSDN